MLFPPLRTALLSSLVAIHSLAASLAADTVRWINPAGGSFEDSANWDRASPPGGLDTAVFDVASTYTVTFPSDRQIGHITCSAGDVLLDLSGRTLSLGQAPGFSGNLNAGQGSPCTVRLLNGQVVLTGTVRSAAGSLLEVTGTVLSDTLPGGGAHGFYVFGSGSTVRMIGGTINASAGDMAGATVDLSGGALLTAGGVNASTPCNITVTGVGTRLRSESLMFLRGSATFLSGASLVGSDVRLISCHVTASGAGTSLTRLQSDSTSTVMLQNGAAMIGGIFQGPVTFGPGVPTTATTSFDFEGGFRMDQSASISANFFAATHGLTVDLDGLGTRTTPMIAPTQSSSWLGGALTVNIRNPNALHVGRVIPILQHPSPNESGAFTSFVAPPLGGNRMFMMSQDATGLLSVSVVPGGSPCWSADFDGDGDTGTDADIESFFACLAGACCPTCASADFNSDGDSGTDADIESFFRILAGGSC